MENEDFLKYYDKNYKGKIFCTKLHSDECEFYIMYTYQYKEEIENFSETFLVYLPYYIRNTDQLSTIDDKKIDEDLIIRSKMIKKDTIIPKRDVENSGLYGELFLDFYLRIVRKHKLLITYAQKSTFNLTSEIHGVDNVVYYIEDGKPNICFCEAKFVSGASKAKTSLLEDINGKIINGNTSESHLSKEYLDKYIGFIIAQDIQNNIHQADKELLKQVISDLNNQLDKDNKFVDTLIKNDICCNFIFFAIFDSTKKSPDKLIKHYKEIKKDSEKRIKQMGIKNYKIEIVFIPTDNNTMVIKKGIEGKYE